MSGASRGTDACRAVKLAVEECHELLTLPRANELAQVAFAGFVAVVMELLEHGVGNPGVNGARQKFVEKLKGFFKALPEGEVCPSQATHRNPVEHFAQELQTAVRDLQTEAHTIYTKDMRYQSERGGGGGAGGSRGGGRYDDRYDQGSSQNREVESLKRQLAAVERKWRNGEKPGSQPARGGSGGRGNSGGGRGTRGTPVLPEENA